MCHGRPVEPAARPPAPPGSPLPPGGREPPPPRAAEGGRGGGHAVLVGVATALVVVAALAVRSRVVFGLLVVAGIFVPLERILALHRQRVLRRGWRTDLVHLVANDLLSTIGVAVAVVSAGGLLHLLVPDAVGEAVARQPAWAQLLLALVVVEMGAYWSHRAAHRVPVLWRFHRVHHSIGEIDWLAAARLHPIDQAFGRSCVVLPLFALGFERATFGVYVVVVTLWALFVHANVRVTFGPLRYVVTTPEYHHWHHAADPEGRDVNFGGQLPLVDALFGTLHLPKSRWPRRYGLDEPVPAGYLRQLAWPFRRAPVPTT